MLTTRDWAIAIFGALVTFLILLVVLEVLL